MNFLNAQLLAIIFGSLGNVVAFMVFLVPLSTFHKIYKRKSSEGFQFVPYVVALFSAQLLLYYGLIKTNAVLIISINAIGCVIEIAYIFVFWFYATKKEKVKLLAFVALLNVIAFGLVVVSTLFASRGAKRVVLVGWMCAVVNVLVFAAPLSIMRKVIKTKSVEFMPLDLSLCLILCATTWFLYGLCVNDKFIAVPNVVGFAFGIAQICLYLKYKESKKESDNDRKSPKGEKNEGLQICDQVASHDNSHNN
ncbi:unnamed protein product [Cuscuta europaea]|uniref:Bidirectional sugar transporter SWEET n=1 Tax=Cuscuta europaea TaxID=41803 RepID=A0A9P0YH44_CUSEU|nr:unnamed protein product [Cuscuta europaea]